MKFFHTITYYSGHYTLLTFSYGVLSISSLLESIMKQSLALLRVTVCSLSVFIILTAIFPLPTEAAKERTFADIKDLTWDGKQFIAVGRPGLVLTSPDGVSWSQRSVGQGHEWFKSVAWGNGIYVMIAHYKGRDCTFTSQDGLDWKRNCPEAFAGMDINSLHWANNSFVALCKNGQIFLSEEGEQWQRLESGTSENLVGLAGGEKDLMIIGQDGLVIKGIFKGTVTTHQQPKLKWNDSDEFHKVRVDSIAWSGREFITVGNLAHGSMFARSEDGKDWVLKYFSGYNRLFNSIAWGNGRFVAVGQDIAVSSDGHEWQFLNIRREHDGSSIHLEHIIAGGGRFLTTGESYGGNAFISDDGFSWRGATEVALDPSGVTILPDKLAKTEPIGEKKELHREKLGNTIVSSLMYFAMSGISFLLFGFLQFLAIHRMRGGWLFFAILPLIAGLGIVAITVSGLFAKSNLWPIGLILLMPAILIYLAIILLLNLICCKRGS